MVLMSSLNSMFVCPSCLFDLSSLMPKRQLVYSILIVKYKKGAYIVVFHLYVRERVNGIRIYV